MKRMFANIALVLVLQMSAVCSAAEVKWRRVALPLPIAIDGKEYISEMFCVVDYSDDQVPFEAILDDSSEDGFIKKQVGYLTGDHYQEFVTTDYGHSQGEDFSRSTFDMIKIPHVMEKADRIESRFRWGGIDYIRLRAMDSVSTSSSFILVRKGHGRYYSGFTYLFEPVIQNLCLFEGPREVRLRDVPRGASVSRYKVRFASPIPSPDREDHVIEFQFNGQVVRSHKHDDDKLGKHHRGGRHHGERYGDLMDVFEEENFQPNAKFILDAGVVKVVFYERQNGDMWFECYAPNGRGYKTVNTNFFGASHWLFQSEPFLSAIKEIAR